jgi:hypothetical protein
MDDAAHIEQITQQSRNYFNVAADRFNGLAPLG